MEHRDVLIIGQGLAGTWLGRALDERGLTHQVIDKGNGGSASAIASGIINPITGRRWVKTWMIEELMPYAWKAYQRLGDDLGTDLISETEVIDFFPTVQMLQAFQQRLAGNPDFLQAGEDRDKYAEWFRYELGWGSVQPVYLVQANLLVETWRKKLKAKNDLKEERFDPSALEIEEDRIIYQDTEAAYLVYCDGAAGASSPLFARLPFSLNKGEALLIEAGDIPPGRIFKKGLSLVPWKENLWWAGSSYTWDEPNDHPTEAFRMQTQQTLKNFIKSSFKIVDHFAAVRPATLERRPFVGFHPKFPRIGLFNGLGTKGCSLAPWFAAELAENILSGKPIDPLADTRRFTRQLSL